MKILVDTSVWSLALRRKEPNTNIASILQRFIEEGEQLYLIGIILQELLQGVTDAKMFRRLANYLAAFPLLPLTREDYIQAARVKNYLRRKGQQVATIDALIAATCLRHRLWLFSVDNDFKLMTAYLKLKLLKVDS